MIKKRKGIILAGGSGTRLYPLTISISKQLMPVFDKPMIYYPLSMLMLADIREILIITTPHDVALFKKLLGDGSQFGVKFEYKTQDKPDGIAQSLIIAENFLNGNPSALVLGDNLFFGSHLVDILKEANAFAEGATIFAYKVAEPENYGVIEFSSEGRAVSLEEKPKKPKSKYAVPGLYFYDENGSSYAKELKPSSRGELEITDLNLSYLKKGNLQVKVLGRGIAWLDTGTHDTLLEASNFVSAIEKRQGLKIACPEEIAFNKEWIDTSGLEKSIGLYRNSGYARYLQGVLEG